MQKNQQREALWAARQTADRAAAKQIGEISGQTIHSVWELVNEKKPYPGLIPALIAVLDKDFGDDGMTNEGIVRALTTKEAAGKATKPLINYFLVVENPNIKWAIGNAIATVMVEEDLDDVIGLWKDNRHGKAREMLALGIAKMNNQKAFDALMEGLHDEGTAGHAVWGLYTLGNPQAKEALAPFTKHKVAWVRKYARLAQEKM